MKDKRIEWIDVAKAIGVIIVLAYHACPDGYFKNMMWQMHMPLFAFLSGIVYKKKYSLNFQKVRIFIVKREKNYISRLRHIAYSFCSCIISSIKSILLAGNKWKQIYPGGT